MGCTELFVALFQHQMNHNSKSFNMDGEGEDLFFLSNGHISAGYYSILARSGYFPPEELATFRKLNSRLQGHPATKENLPGIRLATGSLGQGLSVAIGAAISKKMKGDSSLVYVLQGDGELQEGQNWEAFLFGAHQKIDNIITTIDYNGKQIDGDTEDVMSLGNLEAKLQAFGWSTLTMDGNNMQAVVEGLEKAKSLTGNGKPIAIVMTTKMAAGVDFMEDDHHWHGVAPNDDQLSRALDQLPETIGDF